jgi:colanic acid biosynthesis protein WcaH
MPKLLSHADLSTVVRLAPLIAIDFILRNPQGEVLLGRRNNEPAKGTFFVPGGIILKNEPLREAFTRLLQRETGLPARLDQARFLGVYEHFYPNNRFGDAGYGTHYIVLGYAMKIADPGAIQGDDQHSEMRWWSERDLLASAEVQDNTKAYFRDRPASAGTP